MTRKGKKKPPKSPFFLEAGQFAQAKIVVGFSGDIKVVVEVPTGQVPESIARLPEKWVVAEVSVSRSRYGGFAITPLENDPYVPQPFVVTFPTESVVHAREAAGSSISVSTYLTKMGVEKVAAVIPAGVTQRAAGAVSSWGFDEEAEFLIRNLEQANVAVGAISAVSGGSFTLAVREIDTGRSWVICQKGDYDLMAGVPEYLTAMEDLRALVLTSVRPPDWRAVRAMLQQLRHKRTVTVVVPHPTLLSDRLCREELEECLRQGLIDLFWMNSREATDYLVGNHYIRPGAQFDPTDIRHIARGSNSRTMVKIVTMGGAGMVLQQGDNKPEMLSASVIRQRRSGDTAGDAALAAFLKAWIGGPRHRSAHVSAQWAVAVGGYKVMTGKTAAKGVPTHADFERWLRLQRE